MTTQKRPFWRRLAQAAAKPATSAAAAQNNVAAAGLSSAMRPLALEQRFMFDGAGAADAAHAAADGAAATDAAADTAGALRHALMAEAAPATSQRQEVVFVDSQVANLAELLAGLSSNVEVAILDASKDGLQQIADYLQGRSGIDAIHILSHGDVGKVQLGNTWLDGSSIALRSDLLSSIGQALDKNGDILLYGCQVGADGAGRSFVDQLADATGADVAASSDMTGATALGGNWVLEVSHGAVEAAALDVGDFRGLLASFNDDFSTDTGETASFTRVLGGVSYTYTFTNAGDGGVTIWEVLDRGEGNSASVNLASATLNTGTTEVFTIARSDGDDFTFNSIYLNNTVGETVTVAGYLDGVLVGTAQTVSMGEQRTLNFGGIRVNEVRISSTDFFSTNIDSFSGDSAPPSNVPTVSATADNPTFVENGAAVTLFSSVAADTHDSGQTFTGAQFTVSNVAGSTEYLTIHGVNVALSNGNSVSLGSGYVNVSVSGGLATIALSGATLSNTDMSSLLSGMTYSNSSDNPGNLARTVTLTQLTDSGATNNTVALNISSTVTVVPVNDAPTEITLSSTVLAQSQGSNATVATLSTTDVDSTSFTYSLVSGSGSTDNARFTLTGNTLRAVDASAMPAGTYSIRLCTTDNSSASYDKVVTLTVADDIAPTFDQAPTVSNATVGGFTLSGSASEAGNVYYVVVADGASAPSVAQVIAGQTASGGIAMAFGSQVLNSAPYDFSLVLTGLAASTMYDVYVVTRDSSGNSIVSAVKVDATTASAGTPPSLSAVGSSPVFIGGMTGSVDLFAGVSANTNDSGQTFSSLAVTVSNVTDSGEFINVAGNNISLSANSIGTLTGIGSYSVTRAGSTVTLLINGMSASNDQLAGLVDGLRYGNSNSSVTAGTRAVTLTAVSDSGASNNTTALNLTSSVSVLASNSALYVTSGDDTGADAVFGNSIQEDVNDGGGLSLREALYWANNTYGVNRIVFQTDVALASSVLTPTQTMLIDGQSFTLNGGGYSGFQITTSSITFAIQNLTLTNFTTRYNTDAAGIIGISSNQSDVNLRLYNVEFANNADDSLGNGIIDLRNLGSGKFNFDFDRVNFHDNILYGLPEGDGVIRLFVSGTMQTVNMSLTNTAFVNNNQVANNSGSVVTAGLYVTGNQADPVNTHISLSNVTMSGQTTGIIFEFTNSLNWNLTARNSIIEGTSSGYIIHNYNNVISGTVNVNLIGTNNLIGANVVDQISTTDPRLAASATNAINQGSQFYVTGGADIRGLDRTRQGRVDIGAYESQFAAGIAPQVDLNGSNSGVDYSAGVSSGLSNGVAIADSLATITQTDGDTRIWSMTLALSDVQDIGSESLTLSPSARLAAHAAGITVTSSGQTLTLTGGASVEAFQTVLRAIVYVNVAASPTGGTRTISVAVNDDATNTATSSLTIAVGNPPVVSTPIPAQSIAQNGGLNFSVPVGTFTDTDGDSLTLSALLADGSALPAWLSFNAATGTFSGTPGSNDIGSLSIKVTANDGDASVSTTFSLTVTNVNDAPVVTLPIPSLGVWQDGFLNFTVPASTFSDPDGDTLILSATLADGSALPAWLTFNSATRTFSGTPGNADVGNISIKLTATDPGNASASTTFQLFVLNVNDAPEVATPIPTQSVAQESTLNFVVPAGTFTDSDGDFLTLSATLADGSALPAWLSFNTATDTFSGTPGNADVGNISIKLTATDPDNATVSTNFALIVTNVNDAPVVGAPVPPQSIPQDGSLNFTVPAGTFIDPDGDTLTLSATLADGSALPAWLTFNPVTGTFSGTPGSNDIGSLSIKLTATDPDNATVSTNFALIVTNVNDAPVVGAPVPPQSIPQDGSLNFTVPAGTFVDLDGDTLTLSTTLVDGSALPAWLSFNAATGTFSGTPGNADVGSLSIKLTATDPSNASVSTTFSLTVTSVNVAPVTVSMVLDQTSLNAQQTAVLTVRFSEAVTGLDVTDFTVVDGVLSGLSSADGGLTWTATLTPAAGKVHSALQVILNNAGYTDLAGNAGSNTSVSGSYAINTVLPAQPVLQVQRNAEGSATVLVDALEVGAAWAYSLDGGQSWQAGQGSVVTLASPGLYHVQVRQTNAVGNVSQEGALSVSVAPQAVPPRVEWPVMGIFSGAGADAGAGIWEAAVAPVGLAPLGLDADAMVLPRGSGHVFVGSGYATPGGSSFFGGGVATDSSELSSGFLGGYSGVIGASAFAGVAPQEAMADRLVLLQPVDAVVAAADRQVDWKIPPTMFGHSDPLASVQFSMTLANGQPLPAWLKFDARTGQVSGVMPAGFQGELTLRLTARDSQGSAVSTVIKLKAADGGTAARAGVAEQLQRQAQLRAGHMAAQRLHL